ncbi:MAG: GTPase HflX [Planctomycetes bacterium]|nr:GTPase HflX [Planctomycetota bacterium]
MSDHPDDLDDADDDSPPKAPPRDRHTPQPTAPKVERAVLAAVLDKDKRTDDPRAKKDDPLEELASLAKTAGVQVAPERVIQRRERPDVATYLGKGSVERLGEVVAQEGANVVIFDNDLTPGQRRNLEKVIKVKIIDRTELILDIFAQHARSTQARLQVELAQAEYSLPRLRGLWTHLDTGVGRRAAGEKQIEVDKRLLRIRIQEIKRELEQIRLRKERQVKARELFTVAIVGYTNAGKSTLMNRLTRAEVYVADKLFATLDTRTKPWEVGPNRIVLLSDTVGFIRQLPHHLVESFHATLEEVITADLLLHVVDASDPGALDQVKAVRDVLDSLGAGDKPELMVLNKVDRVDQPELLPYLERRFARSVRVSALAGQGADALRGLVNEAAAAREGRWRLEVDVREGAALAWLEGQAEVVSRELVDETLRFEVRCGDWVIAAVRSKARDRDGLRIERLDAPAAVGLATDGLRRDVDEDGLPVSPAPAPQPADDLDDLGDDDGDDGPDGDDEAVDGELAADEGPRAAAAGGLTAPLRGLHRHKKRRRR